MPMVSGETCLVPLRLSSRPSRSIGFIRTTWSETGLPRGKTERDLGTRKRENECPRGKNRELLIIRPQSLMYAASVLRIILQQMRNKIFWRFFRQTRLRCNFSVNLVPFMVKFDSSAPGCGFVLEFPQFDEHEREVPLNYTKPRI